MRTKTLLGYNFIATRRAVIIFFSFFIVGTLIAGAATSLSTDTVIFGSSSTDANGVTQTWSTGIVAFLIFMLVVSLVGSQSDTSFLISRSVARREIFLSKVIMLALLSATMAVLQIASIYLDSTVRWLLGAGFRGLELDIQIMQAPNMASLPVFFLVSTSIMLCFGAVSFLLGSLFARWKVPTIGVFILLWVGFLALLMVPAFLQGVADVFNFMFTDSGTGLVIALKQTGLAALILALAFPVMRRITAGQPKQ